MAQWLSDLSTWAIITLFFTAVGVCIWGIFSLFVAGLTFWAILATAALIGAFIVIWEL